MDDVGSAWSPGRGLGAPSLRWLMYIFTKATDKQTLLMCTMTNVMCGEEPTSTIALPYSWMRTIKSLPVCLMPIDALLTWLTWDWPC